MMKISERGLQNKLTQVSLGSLRSWNQRKPTHLPLLLHHRYYSFVCTLHFEVRM